jgi:glycosyltransferase 2 family protein
LTSDNKKKNHFLKRALNITLSFILSGVFLYIAFYNVDFNEVLLVVSDASIFWIIIFILISLLSHFIRALRWKVILNSVKPEASIKNLFGALMVGYGVNCVIPRFGEITRAVLIGKWENLSRSSMFGAIIVERIIDLIFLGLSILVSVMIWSEDLYISFPWLETTLYLTLIMMSGLILFLYLIIKFKEKFYGLIIKIIGKISEKAAHTSVHIFEMLTLGFASLKGTKNYILTFGLSIILIVTYALSSYVGFFTVGMEKISPVNFEMAWVLMSISAIGVVIPTPGGTGSYHTLAKSALVLLFGFGEVISLSYAFLTHIISYFLFIFTALILFFLLNKQHDNLFKMVNTEVDEL